MSHFVAIIKNDMRESWFFCFHLNFHNANFKREREGERERERERERKRERERE